MNAISRALAVVGAGVVPLGATWLGLLPLFKREALPIPDDVSPYQEQ